MRIAMISSTDAYWTPVYARHFSAAGHTVRVFSLSPDRLKDTDVDVVHVCGARPRRLPLAAWFLAQVPRVWLLLRRYRPDVVFATYMSSNGTVAALAWSGPLVVSGHGGDVLRQLGRLPGGPWLHRRLMRLQGARAETIHVVAEELAQSLEAYGIPRDRIAVIPLGVEVEHFARTDFAAPADVPHIVCTRRQEPVYANDTIVDALAILRNCGHEWRCTFVGGGPLLDARRQQVRELHLEDRVTFTGQIPMPGVRELLQSAHVYVSASTTDGTSSSLLEAMLCGALPVVSHIPGNAPWIEEGRTGLTFPVGDAAALARALERAITDPALRAEAIDYNRALVQREGDLRLNMQCTLALVERAVARHRHDVQGTLRSRKTSKNGPVGGGETLSPVGAGAATARIGMVSPPPA